MPQSDFENAEVPIPRSHDLVWLKSKCITKVEGMDDLNETTLEALSAVYLDARYPSGLGVLPTGQPTLEEVSSFYETARNLHQHCMAGLS